MFVFTILIDSVGTALIGSLLGAGQSASVMVVTGLALWGLCLPAAYLTSIHWGYGLSGLWITITICRGVLATAATIMWQRGKWKIGES